MFYTERLGPLSLVLHSQQFHANITELTRLGLFLICIKTSERALRCNNIEAQNAVEKAGIKK